jgi:predicted metal-dependent phosphoesterase TrpH
MAGWVNPFELPGRWHKANLHTHTTVSDGDATPAERVEQYRRGGYSVLALTDHYTTCDVTGLSRAGSRGGSRREMLVMSGIEFHPPCPGTDGWFHLVGVNVRHPTTIRGIRGANRWIERVRAAGGEVILAHPSWCGQGYERFRGLRGLVAMEVYNSTCDRHGRASSESEWAMALDHGMRLGAVGSDDCHCRDGEDVRESWTWLRLSRLTVAEVLRALRRGAFYASCGPVIHDFRVSGGKVRVRCSAAAKIQLAGGPGQGARLRAARGRSVTRFAINVPKWAYVRAVVTDAAGRKAWTNPIFLRRGR